MTNVPSLVGTVFSLYTAFHRLYQRYLIFHIRNPHSTTWSIPLSKKPFIQSQLVPPSPSGNRLLTIPKSRFLYDKPIPPFSDATTLQANLHPKKKLFLPGTVFSLYAAFHCLTGSCDIPLVLIPMNVGMYASYLYLFWVFFVKTYLSTPTKGKKKQS